MLPEGRGLLCGSASAERVSGGYAAGRGQIGRNNGLAAVESCVEVVSSVKARAARYPALTFICRQLPGAVGRSCSGSSPVRSDLTSNRISESPAVPRKIICSTYYLVHYRFACRCG